MDSTENIEEAVAKWLQYAVERFEVSIVKKKIGVSNALLNSFFTDIIKGSGGSVAKLELRFLFYGRFVDMGVGRGVPIGSQSALKEKFFEKRNKLGQLHKYGRTKKAWYSKTKARELGKLSKILAKEFGLSSVSSLEKRLNDLQININLAA